MREPQRIGGFVPSPPSSGERARVRGPVGENAFKSEKTAGPQGGRVRVFDGPEVKGKNGSIEDSDPDSKRRTPPPVPSPLQGEGTGGRTKSKKQGARSWPNFI